MLGMKAILNIKSNPKTWMAICLKHIYDLITDAQGILPTLSDYSLRNSISQEIENVTIFLNSLDIKNIEEKTDDEYNDIAERAIQKSRRLMMLLEQTGIKEISDKVKKFQGRVSKD